ncbi:MAG: sterol desaturase family protein [Pseudomonadota bacterium]
MDLISLAVPFFLGLIALEWWWDARQDRRYILLSDALSSLSAGAFSTTTGVFTKLIGIGVYAWVLEHLALWQMPIEWFNASPLGLLAWLGALLVWDFFYYWKHRLGHEVTLFWAAHSVHHQSEEYNLTTALRQTSTDFLIGWVVYIPMFLLGVPIAVFATVSAIDLIYQFWVHTRYVDRLGWIDRVFVTPSNHRVHHAQNEAYMDKNYGGILVIWDRLFGTFEPEADDNPPIFGVRKPLNSFGPVAANLQVYRYVLEDIRNMSRWQDKLRVWFKPPGWRPAELGPGTRMDDAALVEFQKYTGASLDLLRHYVVMQFAVGVLMTLITGALAASGAGISVLLIGACLWWLLINVGAFCDGRAWALPSELLRLLVLPLTAMLTTRITGLDLPAWLVTLTLCWSVLSGAVLFRSRHRLTAA